MRQKYTKPRFFFLPMPRWHWWEQAFSASFGTIQGPVSVWKACGRHVGASSVGRVRQVPLGAPSPVPGCRGRGWRLQTGSGLSHLLPASHCLLPRNSELKAQPGSAHWEGMETGRLSFTEITWRGPRLANGVWVPVVPGWVAGLAVRGERPAFPFTACFAQYLDACEPLGVRPVAGNALAKSSGSR